MSKLIIMAKDEDIILDTNICEYIEAQYKYKNKFLLYHITKEEFEIMNQQIKKWGLKERFSKIDNLNLGYNKSRYMIGYNTVSDTLHIADYNNPDKIGAYIIDKNGISYNEEMCQFPIYAQSEKKTKGLKVYTTASYEDIIKHFTNIKKQKEIPNTSLEEIINKVIDNPRDFYIKICNELTIEEREYLKSLIECKTCSNCSNMSCRVETCEKSSSDACIGWDNNELIGKQKVLHKNI